MKEDKLLNEVLKIMTETGTPEAYDHLLKNWKQVDDPDAQLYNYLYCLAAVNGEAEAALSFLEQAVIEKEIWYRPAVFEDEDLASIVAEPRFIHCRELSELRYERALQTARPVFTWEKKTAGRLAVALHGNQQSMEHARRDWAFMKDLGYQVEYIQSETMDSCGLYRWEDEGTEQLAPLLSRLRGVSYQEIALCGFSAGCNEILKALLKGAVRCDRLVLASPWIPVIESWLPAAMEIIVKQNISVTLICGMQDEDCMPLTRRLEHALSESGHAAKAIYIDGLSHEMAGDLTTCCG